MSLITNRRVLLRNKLPHNYNRRIKCLNNFPMNLKGAMIPNLKNDTETSEKKIATKNLKRLIQMKRKETSKPKTQKPELQNRNLIFEPKKQSIKSFVRERNAKSETLNYFFRSEITTHEKDPEQILLSNQIYNEAGIFTCPKLNTSSSFSKPKSYRYRNLKPRLIRKNNIKSGQQMKKFLENKRDQKTKIIDDFYKKKKLQVLQNNNRSITTQYSDFCTPKIKKLFINMKQRKTAPKRLDREKLPNCNLPKKVRCLNKSYNNYYYKERDTRSQFGALLRSFYRNKSLRSKKSKESIASNAKSGFTQFIKKTVIIDQSKNLADDEISMKSKFLSTEDAEKSLMRNNNLDLISLSENLEKKSITRKSEILTKSSFKRSQKNLEDDLNNSDSSEEYLTVKDLIKLYQSKNSKKKKGIINKTGDPYSLRTSSYQKKKKGRKV